MSWHNTVLCKDGSLQPIQCGLVTQHGDDVIGLPLTKVEASVDITNVLAEITLRQTYVNNTEDILNTMYFFPLEENSALHHFEADKDGVVLKGELKLKQTAREEFAQAVSQGRTAFLLEEVKPDILELYVGNLKPGSTCIVTLKYLTELLTESPKSRFTLPTYIAPRYIPASDIGSKIGEVNEQGLVDAPIEISVCCSMRTSVKEVFSPSHNIVTTIDNNLNQAGFYTSSTKLLGTICDMDKDFVLLISCADPFKPIAIVEQLKDKEESYAVMVSMVPEFTTDEQCCELIFLIDCSGSMSGGPIKKAKEALLIFLQSIPADCYFNIVCFGSSHESLFKKSKKYDDDSLKTAKHYANKMSANLGGTEILRPLKDILAQGLIEGYKRQVFVLTDGEVSNEDQVMALVKSKNKIARVFSLGIGDYASRSLVRGIARCGNGTALFCTEKEVMSEKVVTLLSNSVEARIEVIRIKYAPSDKNDSVLDSAPDLPYHIYHGYKLLLLKLTNTKPKSITITTNTPKGEVDIFIDDLVIIERDVIHKLAARKIIQAAEEREERDEKSLEKLALNHKILTKYTSFICVEEGNECEAEVVKKKVEYDELECQSYSSASAGFADVSLACNKKGAAFSLPKLKNPFASKKKKGRSLKMRRTQQQASPELQSRDMMANIPRSASDSLASEKSGECEEDLSLTRSREYSTGPPEPDTSSKPNEDILTDLLSLADSKGCFKSGPDIARVLGVSLESILERDGIAAVVWYTMFVIAYLSIKLVHKKKIWEMAHKKSEGWLKKECGEFDDVYKKVVKVVESL